MAVPAMKNAMFRDGAQAASMRSRLDSAEKCETDRLRVAKVRCSLTKTKHKVVATRKDQGLEGCHKNAGNGLGCHKGHGMDETEFMLLDRDRPGMDCSTKLRKSI